MTNRPTGSGFLQEAAKASANGLATLDGATKVPIAQIPTGTSSSTVAVGNDSRIVGAAQKSANLSDVADDGSSRANLHIPTLAACNAVATANIALSGTQTIDGYAAIAGDRILCVGQSTGSQNGPWVVAAGAWARPTDYPTAAVVKARSVQVVGGTAYAGSVWTLIILTSATVDTTATAWGFASRPLFPSGYVSGASPQCRRAMYAVGGGGGGMTTPATEGSQRVIVRLPVQPTRYRIHIANHNGLDTASGGAFAMTGLWLGLTNTRTSTSTAGCYDGNMASAPTQITGAFNLPSDGSDYVTAWFTTPTITADASMFLSMGWTTSASSVARGCAGCFIQTGAGTAANASVASPASISGAESGLCYFDIRIEYEFTQNLPVGIVLGGSISEGYTPDFPHLYTDKTWHQRLSQRKQMPMASSAVFGSATADWTDPTSWKWTRWSQMGLTIDFAIIHQGTNDVSSGTSADTVKANLSTMVTNLRNLGIKRVYVLTVAPRGDVARGFLSTTYGSGANSFVVTKVLGGSFSPGDLITLGWGIAQETLTINTVSGTTITTTTNSTQNHQPGELLAGPKEAIRQAVNLYIRLQPFDLAGAPDIDWALRSPLDLGSLDPMWRASDGVHLRLEGHNQFSLAVNDLEAIAV